MCYLSYIWIVCATLGALAAKGQDLHCGPRCVQHVLEYYKLPYADLIQLVVELQSPQLQKPARLDRMQAYLEAHGIYTQAIHVDNGIVRWPYPVIVHSVNRHSDTHFLVTAPNIHMADEAANWPTGVYVLTSARPISDGDILNAVGRTPSHSGPLACICVLGAAGGLLVLRKRGVFIRRVVASGILACAVAGNGLADDCATESEFVFAGMRTERDKLVSGVFEGHGELTLTQSEGAARTGKVFVYCAFDRLRQLLRFDRREPVGRVEPRHGSRAQSTDNATYEAQFARTTDAVTFTKVGSRIVGVNRPQQNAEKSVRPFDVRGLGLAWWADMERGFSFEKIIANYSSKPWSVSTESESVLVMRGQGGPKRELWIDTSRGYWPVRLEVSERRDEGWAEPFLVSEVKTTRVNDVWVPEWFRLQNNGNVLQMRLSWKSVNEPIDATEFTYEGFRLKDIDQVVDFRLGHPVVLRDFRGERKLAEKRTGSLLRWTVSGVLLISVLVLWVVIHRRRRS